MTDIETTTDTVEALLAKRDRARWLGRSLISMAIVAVCVTVVIVVRSIGTDRDGWRGVAEKVTEENRVLRGQLTAQSNELSCRSEAAIVESAALGELTIHIGETAEAALRIAKGEEISVADITVLANSLHDTYVAVRKASAARAAALSGCEELATADTVPTTEPEP